MYDAPVIRSAAVVVAALGALVTAGSPSGASSSRAYGPAAWSPTSIAAGYEHTCAIMGGGAKCWGDNAFGQLGDGTDARQRTRPVAVSGLFSGVDSVGAGAFHSCALAAGGSVKCWGSNSDGQLGDGQSEGRSAPVEVSGLGSGVQAIAVGGNHACALLGGGAVKCWGYNGAGQLGDGTKQSRLQPVAVSGLSGGVEAIAAGRNHTCVLLESGDVECWGDNNRGQLGDGTTTVRSRPVTVAGLATGIRTIVAGADYTCALLRDGVLCWGENGHGELGDGTKTLRTRPVRTTRLPAGIQAIAAGSDAYHTCALLTGGRAMCWGSNDHGQLGDGTTTNRTTPVPAAGLESGIQAIAAGDYHTCALLSGGGFKCLGRNDEGQLGNGTLDHVLTIHLVGRGVVTAASLRCSPEKSSAQRYCYLDRRPGTKVLLKERPAKGWRFKLWSEECRGHKPRCKIVFRENVFVTARFVKRRRASRGRSSRSAGSPSGL